MTRKPRTFAKGLFSIGVFCVLTLSFGAVSARAAVETLTLKADKNTVVSVNGKDVTIKAGDSITVAAGSKLVVLSGGATFTGGVVTATLNPGASVRVEADVNGVVQIGVGQGSVNVALNVGGSKGTLKSGDAVAVLKESGGARISSVGNTNITLVSSSGKSFNVTDMNQSALIDAAGSVSINSQGGVYHEVKDYHAYEKQEALQQEFVWESASTALTQVLLEAEESGAGTPVSPSSP